MSAALRIGVLWLCAISTLGLQAQSTLYTVEDNGPRSKRINIVFLSEGYTAANLPNFAGHVNAVVNYIFSRQPWQQYRSYCNIFRIEAASNQSGCDNGAAGGLRDTYFNSGFNTASVPQLLTFDSIGQGRAYTLLNQHVPEYDMPILIVNDTKYGGSGGPISVASINSSSAQVVEHEVGHSFAELADEYDTDYPIYTPSERPNNTAQTVRNLIKWNVWIDAATPVPTPETATYDSAAGLFEGSMYRTSGWYRPHNNSLMRNLNRPVGQINREQFVLSIYSRVDPVDDWTPQAASFAVNGFQRLNFTVAPKQPSVGAMQTRWYIDNQLQAGATATAFEVISDALGNGTHTVRAQVNDLTTFVRNDPGQLLAHNVTWTVTLANQLPATLTAWRSAYGADLSNPTGDGFVNLVKYALGMDPARVATAAQRPTGSLTGTGGAQYLTLTIPRRTKRTDINYLVQISSDLAVWNSGAGHTVTVEERDDLLVVRDAFPISANPRRAMRLLIQAP